MSSPFWKKLSTGEKPQRAGGRENLTDQKIAEKRKGTRAAARIPFFLLMARSGVRAAGGEGRPLPGDGETEQTAQKRNPASEGYRAAPAESFGENRDAVVGNGTACVCAGVEQAGNERDFAVARENRRNHAGHQQADPVHGAHDHGGQQYWTAGRTRS